jgi:hypothetical protein
MKFILLLVLASFTNHVAAQDNSTGLNCACIEMCILQFDANGNQFTGEEACAPCVCNADGTGSLVGNGNTKDSRVNSTGLCACPGICQFQFDANGNPLTGEDACAPRVSAMMMANGHTSEWQYKQKGIQYKLRQLLQTKG